MAGATKAKRAGEKTMAKWKNIDLMPLIEVELKPLKEVTQHLANISWKIFKDTDLIFQRYVCTGELVFFLKP